MSRKSRKHRRNRKKAHKVGSIRLDTIAEIVTEPSEPVVLAALPLSTWQKVKNWLGGSA